MRNQSIGWNRRLARVSAISTNPNFFHNLRRHHFGFFACVRDRLPHIHRWQCCSVLNIELQEDGHTFEISISNLNSSLFHKRRRSSMTFSNGTVIETNNWSRFKWFPIFIREILGNLFGIEIFLISITFEINSKDHCFRRLFTCNRYNHKKQTQIIRSRACLKVIDILSITIF